MSTGGQYFEADPSVASHRRSVHLRLPDVEMDLQVDSGVFSTRAVDAGTVELLRATQGMVVPGRHLDLGCGYGPIACTLALRSPASEVWAVDVNNRALDLTRVNAAALGAGGVQVARPEDVPDGMTLDGIWTNPPIRVGKAALHGMLSGWLGRLAPDGSGWLVVQRHLGADSLAAWLSGQGFPVERVGSRKGYRILRVRRG
jgi:16S rRNA (guanine1207-N2)-methyltransferase